MPLELEDPAVQEHQPGQENPTSKKGLSVSVVSIHHEINPDNGET